MADKPIHAVRVLAPLLRRYPKITLAIVVAGVLSALAEGIGLGLFIPLLQSLEATASPATGTWLIDTLGQLFSDVPAERRLLILGACIVGAVVFKALLAYARDALYSLLEARVGHHLRSRLFAQFMAVGYRFWEQSDQDRLYNTLASETWRTNEALSALAHLIIVAFTLAVYATLLLLISWPLTLLVAVVMGGVALAMRLLARRVERLGRIATRVNAGLANRMLEGFGGMRVIRTFGREAHEQGRFDRASRRVSNVFLRMGLANGLVGPIYELLAVALLVVILVVMLRGGASLPALLVFVFVLYRLQPKIRQLDHARVGLAGYAGSVDEVMSLLDRADKPYTASGSEPFDRLGEAIRFEGVTFRYAPTEAPALREVSVEIPPARTTALVGPSGGGKSTFIKLLLRLYDPTEGAICVNGHALETLDLAAWRRRLAVVGQEGYVFNTSVRNNIAYGRLEATDAEIEQAARLADADGFIRQLPRGYATRVGNRGLRLSGGQKQRLTLARALVRRAELLILDEATNALDSLSEDLIQQALETLRDQCTVVVIAHRLSTVMEADHVIVLDEGRVREQGTPAALLERDGLFAEMYALQHRAPVPE